MAGTQQSRDSIRPGRRIARIQHENGRRLTATLAYDTRSQALPRGVRNANLTERRLLFLADQYEIMLKVSTDLATGLPKLGGQLLADGLPVEHGAVDLVGPLHRDRENLDDDGGFRMVALPPSRYHLDIEVGFDVIEVDDVDLRHGWVAAIDDRHDDRLRA